MRKRIFRRKIEVKALKVLVNDKPYEVMAHFSASRRTLSLRLSKNGFVCNAPTFVKEADITKFIVTAIPKLEKKIKPRPAPTSDDKVWIFGTEIEIPGWKEMTKQKQNSILKGYLLPFLEEVSPVHERSMGVKPHYQIRVRDCTSVFGVNHRLKGYITYSLNLVHYRKDTIESVVAHELAHHFVLGHGEKFYKILLKECPEYWYYRKNLIKHIYD